MARSTRDMISIAINSTISNCLTVSMEEIVHIVPLGWEYDRAVKPALAMHAHRVYVLCDARQHEPRRHYLSRVVSTLRRHGIHVVPVQVDSFLNITGTMSEVTRIIEREVALRNRVYVNVATSGKVAAIGVTLAAMAHLRPEEGGIFYVEAKDYPTSLKAQRLHGIGSGMLGSPVFLPLFRLWLPDPTCMLVLAMLAESDGREMRYQAIIDRLRIEGVRGFEKTPVEGTPRRRFRTSLNVALNQQVIRKLVRNEYAQVIEDGRRRSLRLTPGGVYLASLFSTRSPAN